MTEPDPEEGLAQQYPVLGSGTEEDPFITPEYPYPIETEKESE